MIVKGEERLIEIVPTEKVEIDGVWQCHHRIFGLSCCKQRCRYNARLLEALNRHQRLATEKRQAKGQKILPSCYLSPLEFSDKEKVALYCEIEKIKAAFIRAGLRPSLPLPFPFRTRRPRQ